MKLRVDDYENLSFSDFDVIDVKFDALEKNLLITVEGGFLQKSEDIGINLGIGKLSFTAWVNFEVQQYVSKDSCWINPPLEGFEKLKDICESFLQDGNVVLRGFGKQTGFWTEYKIFSPVVEYEFLD